MLQRTFPTGFIAPCLPTKTDKLPSGDLWLHEIKHDGFRVIARKDGDRVRLYSRPGNDMTRRFPLIAEALTGLRSRSCIIDGEAVACDDNGLASFERIRYTSSPMPARWGLKASCQSGRTRPTVPAARPTGSR
jgi:ATP-dependent DNA ligase